MSRALRAAAAVLLPALLPGCLDAIGPDVGPPVRAECRDEDHDPDHPVHFQRDIMDGIFENPDLGCASCHSEYGESPIGFYVGGLDLSSYEGLRAGGAQSGSNIVIPGRPCESVLYLKVYEGPPFGSRMPLDGPPYLDEEQEQLLADWIAEGALDE